MAQIAEVIKYEGDNSTFKIYTGACNALHAENITENRYREIARRFESIAEYKDAQEKAQECIEKAERTRKNDIFERAVSAQQTDTIPRLEQAIQMFEAISGFLDADARADACRCRIEELNMIQQQKEAEEKRIQQEKQKREKNERKITQIAVLTGVAVLGVLIAFNSMFCSGEPSHEESEQGIISPQTEASAQKEQENGSLNTGVSEGQKFESTDAGMNEEQALGPADPWITEFDSHVIGAGDQYTVGLKSDGTVYAIGSNTYGQCDVSGWTDIISVSANAVHTVGLKSDGTVVAVGRNSDGRCDVSKWNSIVAVSAGRSSTLGLRSDGTVLAKGASKDGQCNVFGWNQIVAISAGGEHNVGLKSNGTVVAVGSARYGECNVFSWTDIVAISAGEDHTVGLKSDGTVVAVGSNRYGQCDVSGWTDIVAIETGETHTVGLKSDGTVVATGANNEQQCDVSWMA